MTATLPGGSWTALVTPFRDGRIDDTALAMLALRQLVNGTAGVVVCGSTGEAAALSAAEYAQAIAIVVQAVGTAMPVIAGCTAAATADAVVLAETAARAGATGLLCAAPPYVRPTQEGLFAHLRAVAHSVELPMIAYDVPSRTGVAFADETIAHLAGCGHIAGIKDATADLARPPALARRCGRSLLQLSGDDATAAGYRAMGGDGCISVTANIAPALCAALHRAWSAGDLARFASLRDRLAPLHAALFAESNPIPVKAGLALLGLCEAHSRAPLSRATAATLARLQTVLDALRATEIADAAVSERVTAGPAIVRLPRRADAA